MNIQSLLSSISIILARRKLKLQASHASTELIINARNLEKDSRHRIVLFGNRCIVIRK